MVDVIARSMSKWSTFVGVMGRNSVGMMCNRCKINVKRSVFAMHALNDVLQRTKCLYSMYRRINHIE